jgi:uncharacterized protein (TIGR02147 family)
MAILNYKQSSAFLKAYIQELPRKGRGEASRIAARLGVSTTLVSQVLAGKKTFTPEQTRHLAEHLGLHGLEADYLMFLVQFERAGSADLKKYWQEKLDSIRKQSLKVADRLTVTRALTDQERAVFYSSPLYTAVRLFTSVGERGQSQSEIETRFELSRSRAAEILRFLVETGLCREEKGRFHMGTQSTHLEQGSPHLLRHHANWRVRAIRDSEDLTEQELMFTSPVSLSREDFAALREEMVGFIKRFLAKVHESPAEEVACLNLDFFWVRK